MKEELKERRERSCNSGITLVALIITIIVLLILAVVAIRAVSNDGIISHAKNAQTQYENAKTNEQAMLESYLENIEIISISEAQSNTMLSKTVNSKVKDKYGNIIVVPAGFKILVDSTTDYTPDTIDVTKGIVIQDANGNEFVWIPVGDVYTTTDTEKTESNTTKIPLSRYTFDSSGKESNQGEATINTYHQELASSDKGNATAKDIVAFKRSAETNHGYYIGRFEAGVSGYDETATNSNTQLSGATNWTKYTTADGNDPQLVCKSNQQVWNYITQKKASELCQNMYTSKPYESDLMNSYAWDTAIYFIQEFSEDPDYSRQIGLQSTLAQTGKATDGTDKDVRCNIYDMAGNYAEWSTETYSHPYGPCVLRGGYCNVDSWYTSYRYFNSTTGSFNGTAFRPLLYV